MRTIKHQLEIFLRFITVGIGNSLVDFGVFVVLTQFGVYYLIAHFFSYGAGMVNSFVWNRIWTFQVKTKTNSKEMARFFIVNAFSAFFSFILLYIFKQNEGFPLIFSKLFATIGGMIINFIGTRTWVFKQI
ncbi:GtrA family protein [Fervidibacillus albus]|uniref:GtrA family protein n=1 Tax=Fervidibacillus albus TaxID=2980026 RepID=A0A9E8LTA2_9BACI|nr:GtrA family protein [Fervidibacillus albus]WAA09214.1 GtrA family protein [Fervidibacillus albus]